MKHTNFPFNDSLQLLKVFATLFSNNTITISIQFSLDVSSEALDHRRLNPIFIFFIFNKISNVFYHMFNRCLRHWLRIWAEEEIKIRIILVRLSGTLKTMGWLRWNQPECFFPTPPCWSVFAICYRCWFTELFPNTWDNYSKWSRQSNVPRLGI